MLAVSAPTAVSTPSDEQLLRSHADGDRKALDELFRRHRGPAYRVAFRLLGQEADALDAVQDAFVKVLLNIDGFEGRSSFKTWLLRVVSNAALDLGRKRAKRSGLPYQDSDSEEANVGLLTWENPTRGLENADLRQALDVALTDLSEPQRQTLALHVDGDLSYREVAETMGISIGTVMSRLYYARQKLQNALTPHVKP